MSENLKRKVSVKVKGPWGDAVEIGVDFTSPGEVLSVAAEHLNTYGSEYENLTYRFDRDCGCRYDCGCSPSIILYGERLETDEEHKKRVKLETQQKMNRLAQYEQLKKEFKDA